MAPAASTGRQRFRWLLVLVVAAMLVVWLVSGGGQGDPESEHDGGTYSSSARVRR